MAPKAIEVGAVSEVDYDLAAVLAAGKQRKRRPLGRRARADLEAERSPRAAS
jgi:hypothetical protein